MREQLARKREQPDRKTWLQARRNKLTPSQLRASKRQTFVASKGKTTGTDATKTDIRQI